MSGKVYLYPIWIRTWHWTNALLCLVLIISGISMHYAGPKSPSIRFDIAVSMHNIAGIILTASYVVFFVGNLVSGNGRNYLIQFTEFRKRMWKQIYYYSIGVFKKEQPPFPIGKERKFNPLQQVTYAVIMYFFMPIIFITGWALLFPDIIVEEWLGINGFAATDLLHIIGGFMVSFFLLIHLYFATMGKTPSEHYKSMITGYHEDHGDHGEQK
jgi:thiosulfate reductase cytochrome b subunit